MGLRASEAIRINPGGPITNEKHEYYIFVTSFTRQTDTIYKYIGDRLCENKSFSTIYKNIYEFHDISDTVHTHHTLCIVIVIFKFTFIFSVLPVPASESRDLFRLLF